MYDGKIPRLYTITVLALEGNLVDYIVAAESVSLAVRQLSAVVQFESVAFIANNELQTQGIYLLGASTRDPKSLPDFGRIMAGLDAPPAPATDATDGAR